MYYNYLLKTGNSFLIDLEDKTLAESYILNIAKPSILSHTQYVVCKDKITRLYVGLLHRLILKAPSNKLVDHINGNGLDCRKENLRLCNFSQNMQNRRYTINSENSVKGVYYRKDRGYWIARITVNSKVINLGAFYKEQEAIEARLKAEAFYFGDFNGLGTETKYPEVREVEF